MNEGTFTTSAYFFFSMAQQPLMEQVLIIIDTSLSHSDTPHSVGLLWTSAYCTKQYLI